MLNFGTVYLFYFFVSGEEKSYVDMHNKADVERLFRETKVTITSEKWERASDHVIANVEKFWQVEYNSP